MTVTLDSGEKFEARHRLSTELCRGTLGDSLPTTSKHNLRRDEIRCRTSTNRPLVKPYDMIPEMSVARMTQLLR